MKAIAWLVRVVAGLGVVALFLCAFLAYFVISRDKAGNFYDGLGRPLDVSPAFVRFLFGQERLWAGWTWFIVEMIVFWGWIGLSVSAYKWSDKQLEKVKADIGR